jgi:hypothetical protein
MTSFKQTYRIYYSGAGLPKTEMPLSPKQVAHHLENLPTALHLHFTGSNFEVETSNGEADALRVTLISSESAAKFDDAIAACVRKVNLATPGLCLLIDRLAW